MKRNLLISLVASIISIVAIVGLLSMPHVVQAAVCTWTGTVDTDWANAGNWMGCSGVTPTLIDSIVINNTANQPIIYRILLAKPYGIILTTPNQRRLGHVT
jgi:hypothetical protein